MYERVRERDTRRKEGYTLRYTNGYNPAGVSIPCNQTYPSNGAVQVVYDMRSTRFHPGKLPLRLNPCCMYKLTSSSHCQDVNSSVPRIASNPSFIHKIELLGDWLTGTFPLTPTWNNFPESVDADLQDWLLAKTRAAGNSGKVNIAVTLGELPETIGMILGPVGRLGTMTTKAANTAAKIIRRSRWSNGGNPILRTCHRMSEMWHNRDKFSIPLGTPKHMVSALSDVWLSYTYGIRPAAMEIDSYIELATNSVIKAIHPETYRIERASKRMPPVKQRAAKRYQANTQDGWFRMEVSEDTSITTRATGHAYYKRYNSVPETCYEMLGLHQPLSSFWEIVPGSFILDWVLNVGLFLNNFEVNPNQVLVGQCSTHKTTIQKSYLICGGYAFYDGRPANLRGQVIHTEERLVRSPMPASETAVKLTPYGIGKRLAQNVSLAALSWQQLTKYMK